MFGLDLNNSLTLLISGLGLIVSTVTLLLGVAAYKKFLTQKLSESQLTLVLELIETIYRNTFQITTVFNHNSGGTGFGYSQKNLFQLANYSKLPSDSKYNYPILFPISHTFTFEPWELLNNPLLPNQIAVALQDFHAGIVPTGLKAEGLVIYNVIGKVTKEMTVSEAISLSEYEGGMSNFIEKCRNIDFQLKKWLKKHGLIDLNQHVLNTENTDGF